MRRDTPPEWRKDSWTTGSEPNTFKHPCQYVTVQLSGITIEGQRHKRNKNSYMQDNPDHTHPHSPFLSATKKKPTREGGKGEESLLVLPTGNSPPGKSRKTTDMSCCLTSGDCCWKSIFTSLWMPPMASNTSACHAAVSSAGPIQHNDVKGITQEREKMWTWSRVNDQSVHETGTIRQHV